MTVTATGFLAKPMDMVRQMLAASSSFQTWVGAANSSAALASIFLIAPDASGDYPDAVETMPYPFALINFDYSERNLLGSGPSALFSPDNRIRVSFEMQNSDSHKNVSSDPALAFLNAIGAILADLEQASQGSGGLQIKTIFVEKPQRKQESYTGKNGDFYELEIKLITGYR